MSLIEWIGVFGAGLILAGFLLRRHARFGVGTMSYALLNSIGAAILIVYAWELESWPFLILNFVWLFDAVRNLRLFLVRTRA